MKAIVFVDETHSYWLHIDKIKQTYSHEFRPNTTTTIYMINNYRFTIIDRQKNDFLKLIYEFAHSDEPIMKMKVKKPESDREHVELILKDWIEAAVN